MPASTQITACFALSRPLLDQTAIAGASATTASMAPVAEIIDRKPEVAYTTGLGTAWIGDSVDLMAIEIEDETIDLVVTSPPFALQRPKEYGNESQDAYRDWFLPFADEIWRILKPSGSFVVDLGGAWEPGNPVKSLYQFELLIALCRRPERAFSLAQDLYWYNPARLPGPAQWVTVERTRVKDSVNYLWWLSKTPHPKADNSNVLRDYTQAMQRLIATGDYNRGRRPSGHVIREGFTTDKGGAIPPNILAISNTGNDGDYSTRCREVGLEPHPARFPRELPEFFINFLTEPGDLVLDPFAGSNVTGCVAESLGRHWISVEMSADYVKGSVCRFHDLQLLIS